MMKYAYVPFGFCMMLAMHLAVGSDTDLSFLFAFNFALGMLLGLFFGKQ